MAETADEKKARQDLEVSEAQQASLDKAREAELKQQDADAKKEAADSKEERERNDKLAAKAAEQDEADIEVFLQAHRGERLLRGTDGSLNHLSFQLDEREELLREEREEAVDGKKKQQVPDKTK
jgi:hypothetical protein